MGPMLQTLVETIFWDKTLFICRKCKEWLLPMAKDWRPWKCCFKPASPRLLRRSCLCVHLHRWNRHLQDQPHSGLAYRRVMKRISVCKKKIPFICQVWLYVVKEFGLVFAVHQTFLLDHQFCMVESKLLSYSAENSSNSHKTPIPCSCLRPGLHFPVWLVVGPRELDQLNHPKLIIYIYIEIPFLSYLYMYQE